MTRRADAAKLEAIQGGIVEARRALGDAPTGKRITAGVRKLSPRDVLEAMLVQQGIDVDAPHDPKQKGPRWYRCQVKTRCDGTPFKAKRRLGSPRCPDCTRAARAADARVRNKDPQVRARQAEARKKYLSDPAKRADRNEKNRLRMAARQEKDPAHVNEIARRSYRKRSSDQAWLSKERKRNRARMRRGAMSSEKAQRLRNKDSEKAKNDVALGLCKDCGELRGESGTKHRCRSCADEHAAAARKRWHAKDTPERRAQHAARQRAYKRKAAGP